MHRLSTQVRHKVLLNSLLISSQFSPGSKGRMLDELSPSMYYGVTQYPSLSPALWMEWLPPAVVSGWMGFAEDEDLRWMWHRGAESGLDGIGLDLRVG